MSIIDRFTARVRDVMDNGPSAPGGPGARGREGALVVASLADKLGLARLSDDSLGAELERRRRARGKPANRRNAADDELEAVASARRANMRDRPLTKAWGNLELAPGASRRQVEGAFRALLREYHPDKHLGDDEQHQSAVALTSVLTDSYLAVLRAVDPRG